MTIKKSKTVKLEGQIGEYILDYASRCYNKAHKHGCVVEGMFNGAVFNTKKCNSANEVLARIKRELQKNQAAYEKTDEYKNTKLRSEQIAKQSQKTTLALMNKLETINWDSLDEILDWLYNIQPAADNVSVHLDRKKVVTTFKENGFLPNVNTGKDYNADDPKNVARYIIGQALDGFIQVGVPHPVLLGFIDKWREKQNTKTNIVEGE